VVNGTGAPWYRADVGIVAGRIEVVGNLKDILASRVVDATGCLVTPGFIDIHSHSDFTLLVDPRAESKVHQGVTTEVIGQCGIAGAPMDDESLEEIHDRWPGAFPGRTAWHSMGEFLHLLQERKTAVNVVPVVGHGNIRRVAMGESDRAPTVAEMDQMRQLLSEALQSGAFGMSTGLIYPPGVYAESAELEVLAEVLGLHGGIYFTHLRNERSELLEAMEEAITIGKAGDCAVHVSHLKAFEEANWGLIALAMDRMTQARRMGLAITGDQYPYTASATVLKSVLPAWAHDGGAEAMLDRIVDPFTRQEIRGEWADTIQWQDIIISTVRSNANTDVVGKSIAEIASERGTDPGDVVFDLLLAEAGDVNMVYYGMSEEDVQATMCHPLVMIGSDGAALSPRGPLGDGQPHPRSYGTFPRVLGRYSRDKGLMPMEQAVAKMTGWPAATLGLDDRGLLAPGFWADLVVFDPEAILDEATFESPHQFPSGIEWVLVNGEIALAEGRLMGSGAGKVLRSHE